MSSGSGIALDGPASLPMYPLVELRAATEALWAGVARRLGASSTLASWELPTDHHWSDPSLLLSQTCGWPLVTSLAGRVRVVGAFRYDAAADDGDGDGDDYRSVVIARAEAAPQRWTEGTTAAVNSDISLSGWISLGAAAGGRWRGPVRWTGGHLASIEAVRGGDADVASIDAVTWALLGVLRPTVVEGFQVVARGPRVPTLPLITAASASDHQLAALREALHLAVTDGSARQLLIRGFTPLTEDHYAPLRSIPDTGVP